jgi:hypothetical protein
MARIAQLQQDTARRNAKTTATGSNAIPVREEPAPDQEVVIVRGNGTYCKWDPSVWLEGKGRLKAQCCSCRKAYTKDTFAALQAEVEAGTLHRLIPCRKCWR